MARILKIGAAVGALLAVLSVALLWSQGAPRSVAFERYFESTDCRNPTIRFERETWATADSIPFDRLETTVTGEFTVDGDNGTLVIDSGQVLEYSTSINSLL